MSIEPLLEHVVPFLLVLFRLAGLFVFAPILSSRSVPFRGKVLFVFALALAVYPSVPYESQVQPALSVWTIGPMIFTETLIGAVLGLIASLPVLAIQAGGQLIGFQMGMSLAQVYNPELDTQSDTIGELMFLLAVATFMIVGGLEWLYSSVLGTFGAVPVGSMMAAAAPPLELYTGLVTSGLDLSLRVAAPVTAIVLLLFVAMGFIMKTMPQINILSVGFAIKIMAGLIIAAAGIYLTANAGGEWTLLVLQEARSWVETLSAGGDGG